MVKYFINVKEKEIGNFFLSLPIQRPKPPAYSDVKIGVKNGLAWNSATSGFLKERKGDYAAISGNHLYQRQHSYG
jgi:hypothetical protein